MLKKGGRIMNKQEEKGGAKKKQTLSLRVTESSQGQAETCQLVAACWEVGASSWGQSPTSLAVS